MACANGVAGVAGTTRGANALNYARERGLSLRETTGDPAFTAGGEGLHRQVFEANRAVQLLVDPHSGQVVEANEAAAQFYGHSRLELTAAR
jgi:hypothetical protein